MYRGFIIILILFLSPAFLWSNIDSLIKLYDQVNDPYQEGRISLIIAKALARKNMDSALVWAERSNKAALYSDNDSLKIVTYKAVGAINMHLNNYDIALVYLKKGYTLTKEVNDTTNKADISNNIANVFCSVL